MTLTTMGPELQLYINYSDFQAKSMEKFIRFYFNDYYCVPIKPHMFICYLFNLITVSAFTNF